MSYINSPTAASDDLTSAEEAYVNSLVAQSYTSGSLLIAGGTGVIPTELSIGANNTLLTVDSNGSHSYRPIVAGANVSVTYNADEIQISATEAESGGGTVTSVSVVTANGVSGTVATATTTPAITLSLGAITPSSVNVSGLTASELVATDGSKNLQSLAVATYPSLTELTYVKGVTSAIQTQIGLKANLASPTFTGTVTIPTPFTLGAVSVTATGTELNYVDGVTSAIQTQLDGKSPTAGNASLITVGTVTTGTWNATDIPVSAGGTGLSTITALSIWVANSSNVITEVTPGAGNSIRINAGGTAWEAYTPSAGAGDMVLADIQTVTGAKTFGSAGAVGKLKIAGTTSGALTVDTSAVAGTATITIPAVTDTLVGKATTDTFTNKTIDADGTGNSITNIENADIKAAAAIAVNKLAALTASEITGTDASGFLTSLAVATYPSLTELTYVKGVTSAIQTQLGTKVTSGGALGTPSSGTGTNITGIPAASILAGSLGTGAYVMDSSLQVATIELGHATDTTLSRVSAGVVAIEGSNILVSGGALGTPSSGVATNITGLVPGNLVAGTLAAKINLGEGADTATIGLELDASMSADERYSGITVPGTSGATIAFGDICYLDVTAGEWLLADASAEATAGDVVLGICVDASTDGAATSMLLLGTVKSAAFPASIALGAPIYVSETAGDITATQPTTTDAVIRVVAHAVTVEPNTVYFNPSPDFITHT